MSTLSLAPSPVPPSPMVAADFQSGPLPPFVLPSPDDWRARITASAIQASGAIFDRCVTSASYDLEPKIVIAKFGDGYAQRRPAGIHTQARQWSVEMRNASATVAAAVLAFLEARNGVDVFSWIPPRHTEAQDVLCPSWSFAYGDLISDGERVYTVTMKFEQVFV
ncbi:phage tail protein [Paraburkholderia dipogonis]|uniref:phage tail protein n=1 Tax=Paraburkholderia dipogonis TaxID=1211383 RepID=UPI0038B6FE21